MTPNEHYAYIANSGDNTLSQYAVNSTTGYLTALSPSVVSTGSAPAGVVVDNTGRFVYVTNSGGTSISMYTINSSSGVLTANSTVSMGGNSQYITTSGNYVYATSITAAMIYMYSINSTNRAPNSAGYVFSWVRSTRYCNRSFETLSLCWKLRRWDSLQLYDQ